MEKYYSLIVSTLIQFSHIVWWYSFLAQSFIIQYWGSLYDKSSVNLYHIHQNNDAILSHSLLFSTKTESLFSINEIVVRYSVIFQFTWNINSSEIYLSWYSKLHSSHFTIILSDVNSVCIFLYKEKINSFMPCDCIIWKCLEKTKKSPFMGIIIDYKTFWTIQVYLFVEINQVILE